MSLKVKSALYLASCLLTIATYYSLGQLDHQTENTIAENITEHASNTESLN